MGQPDFGGKTPDTSRSAMACGPAGGAVLIARPVPAQWPQDTFVILKGEFCILIRPEALARECIAAQTRLAAPRVARPALFRCLRDDGAAPFRKPRWACLVQGFGRGKAEGGRDQGAGFGGAGAGVAVALRSGYFGQCWTLCAGMVAQSFLFRIHRMSGRTLARWMRPRR